VKFLYFVLFFVNIFYFKSAYSFTLMLNRLSFPTDKVVINVAGNSCDNNGLTPSRLLDIAHEAINSYWNQVSTANLILEKGSILSAVDVSGDNTTTASTKADANTILLGCSSNSGVFSDDTILGAGNIISDSSGVKGVMIISDSNIVENEVAKLSEDDLKATIAHEVGHALGIGHSGDEAALMYYAVGQKVQPNLTQDDWDALTYLYPHPSPGSCGTISIINDGNNNSFNFFSLFLFGLLLTYLLKKASIFKKETKAV